MAGRRGSILPALAVSAGIATAVTAPASALAFEGVRIAPSRIDAQVDRGDVLPAVSVTNGSPNAVTFRAEARVAGAQLDGLPDIDEGPGAARRGRRFLAVFPERFTLGPGESRTVSGRVTGGRRRGRGAYGVVLVTSREAPANGETPQASVSPVLRLAANVLLTFPGTGGSDIRATGMRVMPGGRRVLRFLTRVQNEGRLHGSTKTRLSVFDAEGRRRARLRVREAGAVLPGAARELVADLTKVLEAGDYVAVSRVRDGRRRSLSRTIFTLSGPNVLAAPDLRLMGLDAPRPEPDEGFTTAVETRNAGAAPGEPVLDAKLMTTRGVTVATRRVRVPMLAADASRRVDIRWDGVPAGSYRLEVRLRGGGDRSVTFATRGGLPLHLRALDWVSAHLPVFLAGLALAVLAAFAGVYARLRSLQQRLRAPVASGS